MSLADVVNRIAQGTQAGKQAIASGASNAEARQAVRQAAGVQAPPGRIAMETKADQQSARAQAKADAARKQAQQIIAPGSQDTSDAFSDSGEESSAFSKPDEKEKKESEDTGGIMFTPDFVADPNALAMPTGEDMSALTPEQQRQWAAENGELYAELMATLLTLPVGGMGGRAVSAMNGAKAADKVLKAARAGNGVSKSIAGKAVDNAMKRAEGEAFNTIMTQAGGKANPMAVLQGMRTGSTGTPNAMVPIERALAETLPRQHAKASSALMQAGIPLTAGAGAGLMEHALMNQNPGSSVGYVADPEQIANGTLESLLEDAQEGVEIEKPSSDTSDKTATNVAGPKGGKNRSQMQEYYDWLANTDEGRAFAEMYGDFADQDLGYSRLRASGNSDAWGYLLGLQGNQGVDNWRNRYALSGVDFSDDATALDNLMDYLYGDGSINILDYMTNPYSTVQLANDADAIGQMARWLFSEYNYSPETAWMAENGLDANDIAMQAIARQVTNNGWGGIDVDQINDLLAASGDRSKFALVDEDSDEFKNSAWRQQNVVNNGDIKKYGSLMSDVYNPYKDYGLIDEDLSAAMMAAYNADPRHSKRLALV